MLAINGFLEWLFLALLVGLVGSAIVFGGFVVAQLFRNPGRRARFRPR